MEKAATAGGAMNREASPGFLTKLVTSPYLALIFRVYIGGLFIYAGMFKISYGTEFAETIASYQIAPYWSVNILAITMPWLELVCGIMLIVGLRARSATVIISLMLVFFTMAVFINLLRDSPISCGCFSSDDDPISWMTLIRDIIWLGMCVHIFYFDRLLHLEDRFMAIFKKYTYEE